MRPIRNATAVAVISLFVAAAGALAQEEAPEEELSTGPPEGGVPAPVRLPSPSPNGASPVAVAAWTALAALVGMVVASSLAKARPAPSDPLVVTPGTPLPMPSSRSLAAVPAHRAVEAGRDLALRAAPSSVEHALDLVGVLGLGTADVARRAGGEFVVRVRGCSSCEERADRLQALPRRLRRRAAREDVGCGFERGFLEGAFESALGRSVRVIETRCATRPGAPCEFSVR